MSSPNFNSAHKVDGWISQNVQDLDSQLQESAIEKLGKEATSKARRIYLLLVHIITLTRCKPKDFYAKRGRETLLARNLKKLEAVIIEERKQGRELTPQKVAKIAARVRRDLDALQKNHQIPNNQVMTYDAHRDMLEAAFLRNKLNDKKAPWMGGVGFNDAQRTAAPLSLLRAIDVIRKDERGEDFRAWLAGAPAPAGESLEGSITRYVDDILAGIGGSFAVHYESKLERAADRSVVYREIFLLEQELSELADFCAENDLTTAYEAFVSHRLQSGSSPVEIAPSLSAFREGLSMAFERYRSLGGSSTRSVEDSFRIHVRSCADLFGPQGLEHAQQRFNSQQFAEANRALPHLRTAAHDQVESGLHFLETDAGRAQDLIEKCAEGPFKSCLKAVEPLPPGEVIALLMPQDDFRKLCEKYGLGKVYHKSASAVVHDKKLKSMSPQEKIRHHLALHQEALNALEEIDAMQQLHFSQKGVDAIFSRAIGAAVRNAMGEGHASLNEALTAACAHYNTVLQVNAEEARMEELCRLFVDELNSKASSPGLFDAAFVKRYLLDGAIEERLETLEAWALFAKGKKTGQMLNFIQDYDGLFIGRFVDGSTKKEEKNKISQAAKELYSTYRRCNADGRSSALIKALKGSSSFMRAFQESSPKELEDSLTALKNLLTYSNRLLDSNVYGRDLIFEALRQTLDGQPSFSTFVAGLGHREGKDALYRRVFSLFVRSRSNLAMSKMHADRFAEQLTGLFEHTEAWPKPYQLEYAGAIAECAGSAYLSGSRRLDILAELVAAKGRTVKFDLSKIKERDARDLQGISLPAIDEALSYLRRANASARGASGASTSAIFELAADRPEKLITSILPAFIEPLLQSDKDKRKAQDLARRLEALEPQIGALDDVKAVGQTFIDNRDAVSIIALLPPEESGRLALEILDALSTHAGARKNNQEALRPDNIIGFLATNLLEYAADVIVEKISEARDTNVGKLPFPQKQEFYDNFPDVKSVTEHWAYKHGLRVAPKLLNLIGRSGVVGERLMRAPLAFYINRHAKGMSAQEKSALCESMGPVIEVLSLAMSSFLQRHQVEHYFNFLNVASDYMHKDTMTTEEEKQAFKGEVWGMLDRLFTDLRDYPTAVEQVLRAISDIARDRQADSD